MNSSPISLPLPSTASEEECATASGKSELVHFTTDIVSPAGICADTEKFWLSLMRDENFCDSPYYHPQFVRAVASVRNDVEIGLLKNATGHVVGILPYQRVSPSQASPIGGRMSDFHGILAPRGLKPDLKMLMQDLGLKRFNFHALSTDPSSDCDRYVFETMPSHYIDLSDGYDAYAKWLRSHSSTIKRLPQKVRSLQRNHGELIFEFESNNSNVLEQLIELKRNKFQKTNTFDILSVQWASDLLREISNFTSPEFKGVLSALWAGEHLVAAHFGMISNDILHYWFPTQDSKFNKYSVGLQLMHNTCRAAAEAGIKRIDMSYGESEFKSRFCNGSGDVQFGLVEDNPIRFALSKQRYFTRKKLKQIPLKPKMKFLLRKVFPGYGGWHFR